MIYKEYDKERLREQIRRDVEARKAAEIAEREARKRAAEERRKAVVERIRKQQEMEEKRKRDAELARIRIIEEQARKEQEERDRLLADQTGMSMEDQLSSLAEQDYREYLERKAWQRRERERLLEWEREQKRKDELDEEQRKSRMAELEEKKKKLELLRQQQQAQTAASTAATAQAMKEEGDRINKQLRIQNRAKFVSKKISNTSTASLSAVAPEPPANSTVVDNPVVTPRNTNPVQSLGQHPSTTPLVMTSEHVPPSPANLNKQISKVMSMKNLNEIIFNQVPVMVTSNTNGADIPPSPSKQLVHDNTVSSSSTTCDVVVVSRSPKVDPIEMDKFKTKIQAITSDSKLKDMQKELMQEKRGLRLEQRQKASFMLDDSVSNASSSAEDFTVQQKLLEIDTKHDLIENRLNQLIAHMNDVAAEHATNMTVESPRVVDHLETKRPSSSGRTNNLTSPMPRGKSFKESNNNKSQKIPLPQLSQVEEIVHHSPVAAPDYTELFKKIESFIRNCNKFLFAIEMGDSDLSTSHSTFVHGDSSKHLNLANPTRQLTLNILEITQLLKELKADYDPLGYIEKLNDMSKRLKDKIEELEQKQKEIESTRIKSKVRLSPRLEGQEISQVKQITPRAKISPRPNTSPKPGDVAQQSLLSSISTPALPSQPSPSGSRVSSFHESSLLPDKSLESVNPTNMDSEYGATTVTEDFPPDATQPTEDEEIPNPETIPGWEDCIYTSMFSAAHHAAYFGFADVLKFLVKFFDCFIMDKKGRTPLFYAALANRLDCVAVLLELGPDWIDVGDEKGDTPLHAAAISNSVQVLAFLLSCEAHPDTANNLGKTPSHLARSEETLQLLNNSGATLYCVDNSNHMPLWYACADNRMDCVKYLCKMTPKEFLLWQDDEGDSCLHKAAATGQGNVVEILCQHITKIEDLYLVNKRQYTPAHVAANASVLKALYENGANLWILDSKQHMPLFLASFHGRTDCVGFLLDIGTKSTSSSSTLKSPRPLSANGNRNSAITRNPSGKNIHEGILAKDKQGDTALHVAAVCGHIACVSLLLYYIPNEKNNQQLTPSQLAKRAGHGHIYQVIEYYEGYRQSNPQLISHDIFQSDFSTLSSIILYYGSRWSLGYDSQYGAVYYLDYISGASQWDRPEAFDVPPKEEKKYLKALEILLSFYEKYNPDKVKDAHTILNAFQGRYTELFINLANRYNVQDLSMFQGVDFDT